MANYIVFKNTNIIYILSNLFYQFCVLKYMYIMYKYKVYFLLEQLISFQVFIYRLLINLFTINLIKTSFNVLTFLNYTSVRISDYHKQI